MSIWQLATRSLVHFRRTNLALLCGIAIATAVLTGALIVGDSVRGSLKSLTHERLGKIEEILFAQQFFRVELAETLAKEMPSTYQAAVPAIMINQATLERVDGKSRAQSVTVLGVEEPFWDLDIAGVKPPSIGDDQIVINQSLADELNAEVGDQLILRVGKTSGIASDSPLARKTDLVQTLVDLEIVAIIPAKGLGRFSLQASQQIPANAFLSLETLQDGLDQDGKANTIFVASNDVNRVASGGTFVNLQESLHPSLEDLGLLMETVSLDYQDGEETKTVAEYKTLINDRMIYSAEQTAAIEKALGGVEHQSLFTYLSTKLQRLDTSGQPTGDIVPYSTITAVDSNASLGPLQSADKQPIELSDNEIVLNDWTANAMDAKVGETIRVTFFEPESSHSEPVERADNFVLKAIVPITAPDRPFSRRRNAKFVAPPTLANDPDLTPRVEGITDAESIDRWDAPFPMDRSLLSGRDDDYWLYYRTTPKAFVSAAAGQRLWQSRFGDVTSFRVSAGEGKGLTAGDLESALASDAEAFNMTWIRARRDGREASKGTTPFDGLFFGFSMFIILSALILVGLLLRLSLEQRASQIGLLQAIGLDWNRTFKALFLELSILVVFGGLIGVMLGVGYAWLMLAGLKTWWLAAIVTPFMNLTVTPKSVLLGWILGAIAALATMALTLWRFRSISPSRLMVGQTTTDSAVGKPLSAWGAYVPAGFLVVAALLSLKAPSLSPEGQGGAFFGSGACVLIALLWWVARGLQREATASSGGYLDTRSLAYRNLTRNPTRSAMTIGLVAAACFLIVAMSAFRLSPTDEGTGGFEFIGTSDQPIFASADTANLIGLRLQDGDDASCRNLFRSRRPRLIGITEAFIEQANSVGEMEWAGTEGDSDKPWQLLSLNSDSDVIPVVIDKNTAMYGLQIYTGVGTEFERDYGDAGVLRFRIVGLLAGSIFQGNLLIPEDRLLAKFPRVSGYRYFLVDADTDGNDVAASELEKKFSDEGLDLTSTERLLAELLSVQNTYLSTFQSLGGLGLLLGTLGLAAVQVRNVVQRRKELALMRATGYRNGQLSAILLWEHGMLLLGGLLIGILAALAVVLPHIIFGGAAVPFFSLLGTLLMVAIVGLISALIAQRAMQNTPLLNSLREN